MKHKWLVRGGEKGCKMKLIDNKNSAVLFHHQIKIPDGLTLSLHEKKPRHLHPRPRAILLIHSAAFSSIPEYDLQIKDYSLMDFFAKTGYNVFALDIRGYGNSQSPPSDIWVTAELAERDVKSAVDFIRSSLGVSSVDILGWSWGTQVAGLYAQNNPATVGKLVLYAPFWNGANVDVPEPQATRQKNDREFIISDFLDAARVDGEVVESFVEQCLKYDETSPRGSWRDIKNLNKKPILEPGKLTMPTLVIYGEHDHLVLKDDIDRFFDRLPAREKEMVIIPDTDHMAHLELNHGIFQTAVKEFLVNNRVRTPELTGAG